MQWLQVAVGVVSDSSGKILISRRHPASHQGGFWEFPGGKIAAGESIVAALGRELEEELGIKVESASPLIRIHHRYPDIAVVLHVYRVEAYASRARGREGQKIRWIEQRELHRFEFPKANLPILSAIRLPAIWPIWNVDFDDSDALEQGFRQWLARGVKNMQIRCKSVSIERFANAVGPLCAEARRIGIQLVLNSGTGIVNNINAAGIHLNSRLLMNARTRPLPGVSWVGASCHNPDELHHAERLGLDYAFLSPLHSTASHPEIEPLGWERFTSWVDRVNIPVYALGGLKADDLRLAREHGAQGIAGISAFAE
ncbi:MAG: Nudix family hydrolase [Methylococcales bacterium]